MTLWIVDYLNTNFFNINSTGLTYLSSLTMDKTNIYLQFYDFTTGECASLYLGTIFGNPEDIYVCGQFVAGRISLVRKIPFDFITLKWDTIVLSLIDLDLTMPTTPQFPIGKNLKSEECLAVAIFTSELLPIIQTP